MLNSKNGRAILKVENSDFAVATWGGGLHVIDLSRGVCKLRVFNGKRVLGMVYLGNGQLLAGA